MKIKPLENFALYIRYTVSVGLRIFWTFIRIFIRIIGTFFNILIMGEKKHRAYLNAPFTLNYMFALIKTHEKLMYYHLYCIHVG